MNGAAKRIRVCTSCIRSGKVQKAASSIAAAPKRHPSLTIPMKFVTFQGANAGAKVVRTEAGVVAGDRVIALAAAGFPDMLAVLASGPEGRAKIDSFVAKSAGGVRFSR